MMAEPPPKKSRLTLYEDYLSKDTIAEMQARDADKMAAANAKKAKDASLMFKPTNVGGNKKPQAKTAKKPAFSAMHKFSSSTSAAGPSEPSSDAPQHQPNPKQKRGFEDWLGDDDEMDMIFDQRNQQREAAKSKKRSKKHKVQEKTVSYEDHYDPTANAPISGFTSSERKYDDIGAVQRTVLDARDREQRMKGLDMTPPPGENYDSQRSMTGAQYKPRNIGIRPPASLISVNSHTGHSLSRSTYGTASEYDKIDGQPIFDLDMQDAPTASYAPPPPAADIDMEETADEAYARRIAMSGHPPGMAALPAVPNVSQTRPVEPIDSQTITAASTTVPAPATRLPPVAANPPLSAADAEKKAKVAAQIAALKAKNLAKMAKIAAPAPAPASSSLHSVPTFAPPPPADPNFAPVMSSGPTLNPQHSGYVSLVNKYAANTPPVPAPGSTTISAAPSYNPEYLAQQQANDTAQTGPQPQERSSRPGQESFAERHMKKMGWEKGQGLGATGDGITTALKMQAQKRKKKPDAQGGGYVAPANMGKIVGGKKAKPKEGEEATGGGDLDGMSQVVKLSGMLENMDVEHEIAENNLLQEIGEEMGQEYGQVERLYIWRKRDGGNEEVFVKFTSPLSAVRCMKGMDGTLFAENKVSAAYWDADLFEEGKYSLP